MSYVSINFEKSFERFINDVCPCCLGSGELKAMQSAIAHDGSTVRTNDTKVECNCCKGTGLKK